ncbi:MAG: glycerol-3-phosphate 1-O-acyltransferase PlsY [Rikenellaceae bacterium]
MAVTYYIVTTLILIAYLLGSIPSAVMIGKRFFGIDIREHGSKNAGSTNVLRVLGRRAAIPVFVIDFCKGLFAVLLVGVLNQDPNFTAEGIINLRIFIVFAVVLGHIFPIFADFRGGKGVATLVGALMGINPPVMLICLAIWFITLVAFHYVSVASMTGGVCFPIVVLIYPGAKESLLYIIFSFVVAGLLILTHRKNIERLRNGEESKIYVFGNKEQ